MHATKVRRNSPLTLLEKKPNKIAHRQEIFLWVITLSSSYKPYQVARAPQMPALTTHVCVCL